MSICFFYPKNKLINLNAFVNNTFFRIYSDGGGGGGGPGGIQSAVMMEEPNSHAICSRFFKGPWNKKLVLSVLKVSFLGPPPLDFELVCVYFSEV